MMHGNINIKCTMLSLYICFYVIVSFGKSKKSYRAKSGKYGGCEMIVIFFVAKNSHSDRVECLVLVDNPMLGFTVQVILPHLQQMLKDVVVMSVYSSSLWRNFKMRGFVNVGKTVSVLFTFE
jgi:hypothetical protein